MYNWSKERAIDIITNQMLSNDGFSKWLDIHIDLIDEESIELSCLVTQTMTNGFSNCSWWNSFFHYVIAHWLFILIHGAIKLLPSNLLSISLHRFIKMIQFLPKHQF
jgi:hypothetical protein